MLIEDPSGLLQRIPELRALCEDAKVRRAVERGDPFKVYRTLMWARWLGRLRSHREVLDTLLRRRRLFARPLKGNSLFLGTLNGFGATLLGGAEPDPDDGTSIATHALVALFMIPLLPLGAYVVRPSDSNNPMSRAWTFFARVPLGTLPWLYSRAVALSIMALVATGAGKAVYASRYRDVYLANGFEEPLRVSVGGSTREVPPRQVVSFSVPVGTQQGRAVTLRGTEVDALELNVASGSGVVAWNIAGAMPVYLASVVYSESPSDDDEKKYPTTVFCGQRLVQLGSVDYILTDPPESVDLPSKGSRVVRTRLGVATSEQPPLQMCFQYLMGKNQTGQALPFTEAAARLSGWGKDEAERALQAALVAGPAEFFRVTRAWRDAHPEEADAHRTYQWAAERSGQLDSLKAEYAERARKEPDSSMAQYLHARLLRGAEGARALEQLVERFPKDVNLLRAATHGRYLAGNWEGTTQLWERLRAESAEEAAEVIEAQTTALVALGRHEEALALLSDVFKAEKKHTRAECAELYALVAERLRGAKPDVLIAEMEREVEGRELGWLRVRAHLPVKEDLTLPASRLMQVIGKDPKQALKLAPDVALEEYSAMTKAGWALAFGEAVRTGAADSERALAGAPFLGAQDLEELRRFVRGERVSLDENEVTPEIRAAAYFIRSRNASLPADERQRLVEQARKEDRLHGTVTEAIASWSL